MSDSTKAQSGASRRHALKLLSAAPMLPPVSYTHLTLPTKA